MSTFLKDARAYQILFLVSFLLLGIGTRDWTLKPINVLAAIATALVTQALAVLVREWRAGLSAEATSQQPAGESWNWPRVSEQIRASLPSALITSLGLSLLLRTDHPATMGLATSLAILSKFLLRVQDKHIFNPANFGIVAALLLTQDAWVSPGQWGEESWYALLFLGAGGVVLQKVGRWDTSLAFLGSYGLLEAIRNAWLGWSWDVWGHRLMSGSLILFALFMVTDPRTIPNARMGRLMWAIAIASLTFILRNYFFLSTAVFWALFVLAPLTILLDRIWPQASFNWQQTTLPPTSTLSSTSQPVSSLPSGAS